MKLFLSASRIPKRKEKASNFVLTDLILFLTKPMTHQLDFSWSIKEDIWEGYSSLAVSPY